MIPQPVNLAAKLGSFQSHWDPKLIAELNGQHVRLVKLLGEFVWHRHEQAEELFLVLDGELEIQFREGTVPLRQGELLVVPRGLEHCPRARREASVLLFEPAEVVNTGDAGGARTVPTPERI